MATTGKSYQPLALVREQPQTAAAVSKLITSRVNPVQTDVKKQIETSIDQAQSIQITQSISQRIIDSENIFQLFPDLELAAQILISSILSPKDMMGTELIFTVDTKNIPSEVVGQITTTIKDEFEKVYKIDEELPDILRAMLFVSGGYVQAVIPESSVDQIINSGYSLSREEVSTINDWMKKASPIGFLGPRTEGLSVRKTALESVVDTNSPVGEQLIQYYSEKEKKLIPVKFADGTVQVTDDYRLLKSSQIVQKAREQATQSIIKNLSFTAQKSIALEGRQKITHRDLSALLYKGPNTKPASFVIAPTSAQTVRENLSRPLMMRLPTESVIPVYTPGDEKNHVGYFVLIDGEGHPVTKNILSNTGSSGLTPLGDQSAGMSSLLLQRAKNNLMDISKQDYTLDNINEIYANLVESDLIDRLKNGIYGNNIEIGRNMDVYRIMLARSLANQYTRILYLPRELCTYFAFNHYDNGVGKSLIDDLRVLMSLRAIILFAKVMALTKNAIATTHVNMTLDEDDPDPQKTIEMAFHEIIRMRQQYFPLGINSPVDLVDWIQRAGLEFTFEGHPGIPNTKFEFEQKNASYQQPDNELDEILRKQTYMALGIPPETIDNGFNSEFATTVLSNNILLSKRVLVYGQSLSPQLTEHLKKIIENDPYLKNKILKILQDNVEKINKAGDEEIQARLAEDKDAALAVIYKDVLDSFFVSLPKPDVTTVQTQSTAFSEYVDAIDKGLEAVINSDIMPQTIAGELGNSIDLVKATFKSYFLRKWMADNGFLPELSEITATDSEGDSSVDLLGQAKNHLDTLIKNSTNFIKSMQPMADATTKDLAGIEEAGSSSTDFGSSSDDTGGGESSDDFSGMGSGDFDFGGSSDDFGSDTSNQEPSDDKENNKEDDLGL